MNLVFVHGPPACGKYTVAKGVAGILGYSFMHNHLSVDLALCAYPKFGSSDFFEFLFELRTQCIQKASQNNLAGMVITGCYCADQDSAEVECWKRISEDSGGEFIPLYLDVSLDVLRQRVVSDSRLNSQKIQTVDQLENVVAEHNFSPFSDPKLISVNSDQLTERETIEQSIQAIRKWCYEKES